MEQEKEILQGNNSALQDNTHFQNKMENQQEIYDNNTINSMDPYIITNSSLKIDMRYGDIKRQKWIFQEKFMQKCTPQSIQSLDVDQNSIVYVKPTHLEEKQQELINHYKPLTPPKIPFGSQASDGTNSRNESQLNILNPTQKQNEGTPFSKISKGRNTIYRIKQDSMIDSPSLGIVKKRQPKLSQVETTNNNISDNDIVNQKEKMQQPPKSKNVWNAKFFKILLFVNRFYYRNKLKLIHFRPQHLLSHQVQAINDVSKFYGLFSFQETFHYFNTFYPYQYEKKNIQINTYPFNNEEESRQIVKDNIFRSQYRLVRKFRIMSLIFKKKMKLFIIPLTIFQNKLLGLLRTALDPIPVILPYHKLSLVWDFIIVFLILANVIKIPYEIAFNAGDNSLEILSFISRLIFFMDFFMMFNTAYYDCGMLVKQRSKIFIHFFKNRLALEVMAYLCLWVNPFGIQSFRMFFLIKFFSFYGTIEKLAEAFQLSYKYNFIVNLIALLVEVVFLCHLFACIWYSIGNYQQKNQQFPNWIQKYNFENDTECAQYIASLYFSVITIGTIGYGDINPQNTLERGFISCMAIFSCGIFAYILSNIQNVYREYIQKQEVYLSKLGELNNYMINREVNPTLQQMARKYLKYVHEQGFQQGVMPCVTLNSLSKSLREEIKEDIFQKSINCIPLFKHFSNQLKLALSIKMVEFNYGNISYFIIMFQFNLLNMNEQGPDEIIMKSGQIQQPCLYYILKGKVEVCLDKGQKYGSQANNFYEQSQPFSISKQNDIVGLYEFISQSHQSMINAKSIGVTTVHVLDLNDFLDVLNQFSSDKEIYSQFKDSLNLYQTYSSTNIFCYSCKSSQHLIKECPIFFYKPVKQKIINQFNKDVAKRINNITRSIQKQNRFNSLMIRKAVEFDIKQFCEENKSEIESLFETQSNLDELEEGDLQKISNQECNLTPQNVQSEINLLMKQKTLNYNLVADEEGKNYTDKQDQNNYQFNKEENKLSYDHILSPHEKQNIFPNGEFIKESSLELSCNNFPVIKNQEQSNKRLGIIDIQPRNNYIHHKKSVAGRKSSFNQNMHNLKNFQESQLNNISLSQIGGFLGKGIKNQRPQTQQQNFNTMLSNQNSQNNQLSFNEMQHFLQLLTLFNSNSNKKDLKMQQEEQAEDLITETMRTYRYYMNHNNIGIIIKKFNIFQQKNKAMLKIILQKQAANISANRTTFFKLVNQVQE